jgi:hypothetical protein
MENSNSSMHPMVEALPLPNSEPICHGAGTFWEADFSSEISLSGRLSRLTKPHVNVIKPTLWLAVRRTPSVLRNVLPGRSGRQRSGEVSQSRVIEVNFESFLWQYSVRSG